VNRKGREGFYPVDALDSLDLAERRAGLRVAVGIHLSDDRQFDITPAIMPTMRGHRDVEPHRAERSRRVLVDEDLDVRTLVAWPVCVQDDIVALDRAFDFVSFRLNSNNVAIIETVKQSNEMISFSNHATLMFAVNRVPTSPEDTHGWWSRWMYILFPNRFGEGDKMPRSKLMEELTDEEELQGLLSRCVDEIQRYDETDEFFPEAQSPEEVREQMKNAANPVRDFATTAFEQVEEPDEAYGRVQKENIVAAYEQYADERDLRISTRRS